jgi:hypothetical protein
MGPVTIPSPIHREPELLGQTVVVIGWHRIRNGTSCTCRRGQGDPHGPECRAPPARCQ